MGWRRPTRDLERILKVAEHGYISLTRSMEYAQHSFRRNKGKDFMTVREMMAASHGFMAAIKWVLGIGLEKEDLKYVLTEVEEELGEESH